jgi:hypothetical protein
MWFTQSLGHVDQQQVQYYYYPVITICNPLQINTAQEATTSQVYYEIPNLNTFMQDLFTYKIRDRISHPIEK